MKNLKERLAEKVELRGPTDSIHGTNNVVRINQQPDTQQQRTVPFADTINEARERIALLECYVAELMEPEVDYGYIPEYDKPTLFKPGAEKLCDIFGFSTQVEVTHRVEDPDKGLLLYEVKVIIINKLTGFIEAEGIGSCNSREKRYMDTDPLLFANTILKIAKKRAFIDAVLSATHSSGLFTQDIEDFGDMHISSINKGSSNSSGNRANGYSANSYKSNVGNGNTNSNNGSYNSVNYNNSNNRNIQNTNSTGNNYNANNNKPNNNNQRRQQISEKQLAYIIDLVDRKRIPIDEIRATILKQYNVNESKQLSYKQASNFIDYLKQYNPK